MPRTFVVGVKASRFITHIKRLKDPVAPLELFWERASGLGPSLGPVLFQLPPRFAVDLDRLKTFLDALPHHYRTAFEFRDRSWDIPEVDAMLDAAGAATVLADRPGARVREVVTGRWSYVRFHQGSRLGPNYSRAKLRRWADRIAQLEAADVYVYFNNDPGGGAVRDAVVLAGLLDRLGVPVARIEERASA